MTEHMRPAAQLDVQCALGRCMLSLQQYEHLLKALLAQHERTGSIDTLDAEQAARRDRLANLTLGSLAKVLFETVVVPEGFERERLPTHPTPPDQPLFAISFRLAFAPDRLADLRAQVEELVLMRNELVHHFIQRFDLWTDEGCATALRHLQDSHALIRQHHEQLREWIHSLDASRAQAAAFLASKAFEDLFVNGIAPDGHIAWPASGIVCVLREAARALSQDGWTPLAAAREWLRARHPEQTPEKYGRRSWPQVLHDSRMFELVYRPQEGGAKAAWFRERPVRG